MARDNTMAIKVDEYIDRRLEEKVVGVRDYVDLKVAELAGRMDRLEGRYDRLEGQMQGLRSEIKALQSYFRALENHYAALEDRFESLRSEFMASVGELKKQYENITNQSQRIMGLLSVVLERTDPAKIGFVKKE